MQIHLLISQSRHCQQHQQSFLLWLPLSIFLTTLTSSCQELQKSQLFHNFLLKLKLGLAAFVCKPGWMVSWINFGACVNIVQFRQI